MIICVCCVCINRFQCTICLWWSTNETVPFEFNKSTFISDYTYVGTTLCTTYCQIQATAATTRTNRSRYSIRRIFNSHSCYSSSSLSLLLLLLLSLLLSCSRTMELYHFFSRKNTSVCVFCCSHRCISSRDFLNIVQLTFFIYPPLFAML